MATFIEAAVDRRADAQRDAESPFDLDRENRIRAALGQRQHEPLPRVNERSLRRYYHYLGTQLEIPFQAVHFADTDRAELVRRTVDVIELLPSVPLSGDVSSGVRCGALLAGREVRLSLADLELFDGSRNEQLIDDYWYWFWNWQ